MTSAVTARVITFLVPRLHGGGGLDRSTFRLADGLKAAGFNVDVVFLGGPVPYADPVPSGVRVVHFGARRAVTAIPPLVRYLRRERPAVLVGAMPSSNLPALIAARVARSGVPVVAKEHTTVSRMVAWSGTLKDRVLLRFVAWLYPRADEVIAISHGVADDLVRITGMPHRRIRVIPNPVITPVFMSQLAGSTPLLPEGGGPLVLSVGRLARSKGFDVLFRAFAEMRREIPARLLVLGDGPEREALGALAEQLGIVEDVHMPGFVSAPAPYMRAADLFVLASRFEGLGNVIIEAIAAGTPVVSTDCPHGPREILGDGTYGHLVAVDDVGALAESMLNALSEAATPVHREVWEPFTTEAVVARYLDLFDEMLDVSAPREKL